MTDNREQPAGGVEPLPCAFCGSSPKVENLAEPQHPRRITVGCSNEGCFAYLPSVYFAREADAIAAWNRRPPADAGKADSVGSVIEKYRYRHQGPGDPALPPCEVCQFIAELDAATRSVPPTPPVPVSEDVVEDTTPAKGD